MNTLFIDLETYSTVPIKRGTYRYAEESFILLAAYAINDGPVTVLDMTITGLPAVDNFSKLSRAIAEADEIVAHNSAFDRIHLEKAEFIATLDKRWRDTMVLALMHSLPGHLAELCSLFKLPVDKAKDSRGRDLIRVFCIPQKDGKRILPTDRPAQWQEFIEYARLDVVAMRELWRIMPKWNQDWELWQLDQRINDRGLYVDQTLARSAIELCKGEREEQCEEISDATGGAVKAATQRDKLLKHIELVYDITFPDLRKSTVERRLDDENLPREVRDLLRMRLLGTKSSVSKYKTLIDSACKDSRLRGTLQFRGASRTGRDSGRLFQPQNLPRKTMKQYAIDSAIQLLRTGNHDMMRLIYPSLAGITSNCIRGAVCAAPGNKFAVADLSAIEGRVLAWLAKEDWKLASYVRGEDPYVSTYAKTFNVSMADAVKNRQLGKVLELFGGYEGGVGAFVTFSLVYGVDLEQMAEQVWDVIPIATKAYATSWWTKATAKQRCGLDEFTFIACDSLKRMWRANNPATVAIWAEAKEAVLRVLSGSPREVIDRGYARIVVDKKGNWLRCRLPSGRYLCYPSARREGNKIVYRGINQYTHKWGDIYTYGGKVIENVDQGVSNDVMWNGAVEAEKEGLPVVMRVHDELLCEVPLTKEGAVELLIDCMARKPHGWDADLDKLPLGAAGFEALRYRKD